jgi:hypothetical protein
VGISRVRLNRAVVSAVIALALIAVEAVHARAVPARPNAPVYATDRHGGVLASGAMVRGGEHLTITATGFAPRARVQAVDVARRRIDHVQANNRGTARTSFVVPTVLAHGHRPFVALDGAIAGAAATGEPSAGGRRGDAQSVRVTVPLLREFAYKLTRSGVDAGGVGLGSGTHTGTEGHGSQPLADTGFDELASLIAGIALFALGVGVLRTQRKRRDDSRYLSTVK